MSNHHNSNVQQKRKTRSMALGRGHVSFWYVFESTGQTFRPPMFPSRTCTHTFDPLTFPPASPPTGKISTRLSF